MSRSTVIVRGRAELSGSHLLLIDLLSKLSMGEIPKVEGTVGTERVQFNW